MSYRDDASSTLYDPPIPKRGRSASFSASTAAPSVFRSSSLPRRQSFSGAQDDIPYNGGARFTDGEKQLQTPLTKLYDSLDRSTFSDEEADRMANGGRGDTREGVVFDGNGSEVGVGPAGQMSQDERADRRKRRMGRQSKGQEEGGDQHTPDMEQFLAQCYDLTHSIDALENDVDQILSLRNKIASLHPSTDVGQVSLRADMTALSALTTQTGRSIVSLEVWLTRLKEWSSMLRKWIKAGEVHATLQEVGDIKYQLASAKMDFADAMERIREGAWKEEARRERTRIWMAHHMRSREPEMDDEEVRKLLIAAELGAADGVAKSDVTSYAGLWALRNPFTELAELTNGMEFLKDTLDREIVDKVTGKSAKKRVINLNDPDANTRRSAAPLMKISGGFRGKTAAVATSMGMLAAQAPPQTSAGRFKYARANEYMREKDLEYGWAKIQQGERSRSRKKMVIALLLVIIAALVLFVILALHRDNDSDSHSTPSSESQSSNSALSSGSSSALDDGQYHPPPSAAATTMGETVPYSSSEEESTTASSASARSSASSAERSTSSSSSASTVMTSDTSSDSATSSITSSTSTTSSSSSMVWWTPTSATGLAVAQTVQAQAQAQTQTAATETTQGWTWGVGRE